jgi:hypothetical protein
VRQSTTAIALHASGSIGVDLTSNLAWCCATWERELVRCLPWSHACETANTWQAHERASNAVPLSTLDTRRARRYPTAQRKDVRAMFAEHSIRCTCPKQSKESKPHFPHVPPLHSFAVVKPLPCMHPDSRQ